MTIVEIKDLNYSFKNKILFEHLDLSIKQNTITTILGANGSGKSTLANLIFKKYSGIIVNTKDIRMITTNPEEQIIGKTVEEQLMFYLKQIIYDEKRIITNVNEIKKEFLSDELMMKDPFYLSLEYKQLVVALSNVICCPELLIFDDALSFVRPYYKDKIFKYLKKKKITVLNFTNNTLESLYGNYIVILNKEVVLNKTLKWALKEENIFLNNNIEMPFIANLSNKLKYYGLVDNTMLKMDEMVDRIWN